MRGLRIALLTHHFRPEIGAPAARLSETARAWARLGHRVVVLTGYPNHPTGVVPPAWRGLVATRERRDGYETRRSFTWPARSGAAARRTLSQATSAAAACVRGLSGAGGADVFVASSPPLFTGLAARALSRVHRRPFVLEVRDLWPDAAVDLGVVREGSAVAAFRRLERSLYRAADLVVPVTEAFRAHVLPFVDDPSRVAVVRGGVDLARFHPPRDRAAARRRFDVRARFVVLYLGAFGVAQDLARLLPAAAEAGDDVLFWFVGEGAERERLVAEAARLGLRNVRVDGPRPREDVPDLYAAADVALVSLKATPLMEAFLPSKAFEAMGAGVPVVAAVAGEARALLEAGPGAVVVPPGDARALANAVRAMAADPAGVARAGGEARRRAEREFDRDVLSSRYADLLVDVVRRAPRGGCR